VAVVQISKIQVRRGQKNSPSGVPQLSSAEFAWAVDTQELFIGNGSVAEGAPYVGNTKILTEHDNILELASSYRFSSNDTSIINSVFRPLQSKLDETVSVSDYGAVGDGITDNSDVFERAFADLFQNVNKRYRKVLLVPNGDYVFSKGLKIPSFVKMQGETRDRTRLIFADTNITLLTEDGKSVSDFVGTNRPQNIEISNLTISRTTGQTVLTGLTDGIFHNVSWVGEYELTDPEPISLSTEPSAIFWENSISDIAATRLTFEKCQFYRITLPIKCLQTITADTEVYFDRCEFLVNHTSTFIEASENPSLQHLMSWKFYDCTYRQIFKNAFRSTKGRNITFKRSKFKDCGNGNNSVIPISNIIYFGEDTGNTVLDCEFNRQQFAGIVSAANEPAIAEVYNSNLTSIDNKVKSDIYKSETFRPLAILSAFNRFMYINYHLRLGGHSRIGTLTLTINDDLNKVSISDHYQYSDNTITGEGGKIMTGFEFDAELADNGAFIRDDVMSDSTLTIDTVIILYKNPTLTGADGDIVFDVSYGV